MIIPPAASDKEQNSCTPTGLWLELGPYQYWTISVIGRGPIMEDEGNLTVQNLSGRQPLPLSNLNNKFSFRGEKLVFVLKDSCFLLLYLFIWILIKIWFIPLCKITQLQESKMRLTGWTLSYREEALYYVLGLVSIWPIKMFTVPKLVPNMLFEP